MNNSNDLNLKLTVLLTIKGRPDYTNRWLTYHNKINFPFKIIIADGERNSIFKNILKIKNKYPNLDFKYVHYNESDSVIDFFKRTTNALCMVETPYVLKAAHDDFFIKDGLKEAMRFLESHDDYVCSRGENFEFSINSSPRKPFFQVYGPVTKIFKHYFIQKFGAEKSPLKRIKKMCLKYCTNWYSIYRTETLLKYHQLVCDLNMDDARMAQQLVDFLTLAEGKVNCNGSFFMFYQNNSVNNNASSVIKKYPTWKDWMENPSWKNNYNNLSEQIIKMISKKTNLTTENAEKKFNSIYFDTFIKIRKKQEKNNFIKTIHMAPGFDRLLREIKLFVINNLSFFINIYNNLEKLFASKINKEDYNFSEKHKYYNKIKPIIDFIGSPPEINKEI